ncbi:hypothetical protein ACOI22_00265 [Glaciecola sp. 2405UD65-10]|uniref:hypothetical protein n=1 Tax=Glaciecola sp. 2405UD65-10 TaxID=3397244 RepID=UPI003B5B0D40
MMTFLIIASFILCAAYFFVETVRNGMAKKRWVMAGILLGPMMLPMFHISKQVARRKSSGFNYALFRA